MLVKFKVYDKQLKIVRDVKYIDYENTEVLFNSFVNEDVSRKIETYRGFDDVIFLMSTGIIDKDGAEIFEGDICYWEKSGFRGIFTVSFGTESLKWIADSNCKFNNLSDFKDYYLKIIGNVYEGSQLYQE